MNDDLPALPEPTEKEPHRWSGPYWSVDMIDAARGEKGGDRA